MANSTRSAIASPITSNDDTATLAISVGPSPTHKVWATQSGFTFPVLADFWPHGAVGQAYGVFNDDSRVRQPRHVRRGPRRASSGSPRCKQPGEVRDQAVWSPALAALRA